MSGTENDSWQTELLSDLIRRPGYMTEVRRDGKDDRVITNLIKNELKKQSAIPEKSQNEIEESMKEFASACWQTCEKLYQLMLDDEQPENEKQRLDPDHWYEINLTNALLFANLSLDGLPQLVPGRLFSTRMPRNIEEDSTERSEFVERCKLNNLRVIPYFFSFTILSFAVDYERVMGSDRQRSNTPFITCCVYKQNFGVQ